jgi:hypothetical protein
LSTGEHCDTISAVPSLGWDKLGWKGQAQAGFGRLKFENCGADYLAAWRNAVAWEIAAAGLTAAKLELGLAKAVGWATGAWAALERQWSKLFES